MALDRSTLAEGRLCVLHLERAVLARGEISMPPLLRNLWISQATWPVQCFWRLLECAPVLEALSLMSLTLSDLLGVTATSHTLTNP